MVFQWTIIIDIVEDVRGSIGMYLFIIEEAIQTIGMANYLAYKAGKMERVKEIAQWTIDEVIDPAINFNNIYGYIAYPLNQAYAVFYDAARKNMETYLEM